MTLTRDSYINIPSPIEKELKNLFEANSHITIFDIGSCEGEDSVKYSKLFPKAKIYAVEALPNNIPLLRATLEKYSVNNVEILPFALSDSRGQAKFYVSSGSPDHASDNGDWDYGNKSSSLLPPNEVEFDKYLSWLQFNEVITVETHTLEDVCKECNISEIDFIHIDVQGAEIAVLRGARNILKGTKLIWLEVEAVPYYKNQPLKQDVEQFMEANGFYKVRDTVGAVDGDQLYVNLAYSKHIVSLFFDLLERTRYEKTSYSLCGEDLIVKSIFDVLGVKQPTYLDIGAFAPELLSNTALFYLNGSRGINIQPDTNLFQNFLNKRQSDINLNIGISNISGEMDFYVMSNPFLNTFSKKEADSYSKMNCSVTAVPKIKVDTFSNIIATYCGDRFPDFLSVDFLGMDNIILESINYETSSPTVICVKTMTFSPTGSSAKNTSVVKFLESKGYMVFADTYINTIFVKRDRWVRS